LGDPYLNVLMHFMLSYLPKLSYRTNRLAPPMQVRDRLELKHG